MQRQMNDPIGVTPEPVPPEPVTGGGLMLREGRESRGLDIERVASDLRLTPRQVQALEEEDFSILPEPTYVCGYVRNYARYLNLPSDDIIASYPNLESLRPGHQPMLDTFITRADLQKKQLDIPMPLVVSVALLVIIVTWYVSSDDEVVVPQTAQTAVSEPAVPAAGSVVADAQSANDSIAAAGQDTEAAEPDQVEFPSDGSLSKTTITNAAEAARGGDSMQMRVVEQAALTTLKKIEQVEQKVGAFNESDEAAEKALAHEVPAQAATQERITPSAPDLIPASKLTIRYSLDSWTDVVDAQGRKLIYKLGKAGTSTTVVGVAPFKAFFGYVPGVEMSVNDRGVDMTPYQLLETANIRVGAGDGNTLAYGIKPGVGLPDRTDSSRPPVTASTDRNRVRQEIRQSLEGDSGTRLSSADSEPKNANTAAAREESGSRSRDKVSPAPIFDLFSQ